MATCNRVDMGSRGFLTLGTGERSRALVTGEGGEERVAFPNQEAERFGCAKRSRSGSLPGSASAGDWELLFASADPRGCIVRECDAVAILRFQAPPGNLSFPPSTSSA